MNPLFWSKVDAGGDCWEWISSTYRGYGIFRVWKQATFRAHRYAWEQLIGPIPDGLHLDHLCRNKRCVNPDHLEPVTPRVNTQRSLLVQRAAEKSTRCRRGHPYEGNQYTRRSGERECTACRAIVRRLQPSRQSSPSTAIAAGRADGSPKSR